MCFGGGGSSGDGGASASMLAQSQENARRDEMRFQQQQAELKAQKEADAASRMATEKQRSDELAKQQKLETDRTSAAAEQERRKQEELTNQSQAKTQTGSGDVSFKKQAAGILANNAGLPGFSRLTNFRNSNQPHLSGGNVLQPTNQVQVGGTRSY